VETYKHQLTIFTIIYNLSSTPYDISPHQSLKLPKTVWLFRFVYFKHVTVCWRQQLLLLRSTHYGIL